ncbi:MAG: hypothetical protein ACJAVV_002436 [Alphaproteobacteria bacterium]|jgi:hypothetical protein
MAPKDYVKRPRAKKPAQKRNTRNPRAGQASALPWVKITFSLLVVGLFIFGLYRLQTIDVGENGQNSTGLSSQGPNVNTADGDTVDSDSSNLLTSNTDDLLELEKLPELPVLGEEEWEYIDSLPDYSVEVDATGPLQSDKDFIMQCGSFRTLDRAQTLRAKIAFQGLESRILTSNGRNGLWYRVVLGPYERKRNAERHRHQLRNGNVNGCKIW